MPNIITDTNSDTDSNTNLDTNSNQNPYAVNSNPTQYPLLSADTILTERYQLISWQDARDILILYPRINVYFNHQNIVTKIYFIRKFKGQLKLFLNHQCTNILHVPLDTKLYTNK